ncbi:hypothetical protein L1049_000977 [Liquidambar formosana]|uniref:Reverse transcriptase zinc-binding domain-containing protein n=1 Tax=Liquidambar formosana TaxID=63359 RepID=A0AAP0N9R7_LIQFO
MLTIRSAYHLAMEHRRKVLSSRFGESSTTRQGDLMIKLIWKQNIPTKIKHFMWKACKDILPTKSNLLKRKVQVPPQCEVCGNGDETTVHALKDCSWAATVWHFSLLGLRVDNSSSGDLRAWLSELHSKVREDKMAIAMTIM